MGRDEAPTTEHNLCTLDTLRSKRGVDALYIDGVVSYGGTKRFIKQAPFDVLSIAGYDDLETHSATGVFIKTGISEKHKVWLRLGMPSNDYTRYHNEFVWVATFGKHVVDFMLRERDINLIDFKFRFLLWLNEQHGESKEFRQWAAQLRSADFRVAFNRHFQWLWSEAVNEWIDIDGIVRQHPIWQEADTDAKYLTAVPQQPSRLPKDCKTIVTPFVQKCFKDMYFGKQLQPTEITDAGVRSAYEARRSALGFAEQQAGQTKTSTNKFRKVDLISGPVAVGDVIGVQRDDETAWLSKGVIWFREVVQLLALGTYTNAY
jgi:DNA (cytosine-5)-methyltransferase 1